MIFSVGAEEFCAAAAVDDAVTHDGCVGDVLGGDERLAEVAFVGEDAALAGDGGVEGGVAGGEEGGSLVDEEGDAGAEFEGAREEGVEAAAGV